MATKIIVNGVEIDIDSLVKNVEESTEEVEETNENNEDVELEENSRETYNKAGKSGLMAWFFLSKTKKGV